MVLHWSESNKKAQLVNDYYKLIVASRITNATSLQTMVCTLS